MIATPEIDTLHNTESPFLKDIRVAKSSSRAILPSRRDTALKRLDDFESELGRLKRLATELRADILALTVE